MTAATATFILSPLDSLGSVYHCTALVWLLGVTRGREELVKKLGEHCYVCPHTHTHTHTYIYYWMRGVPVSVYIFISTSPPTLETHTPTPLCIHKLTKPRRFLFFYNFFFFACRRQRMRTRRANGLKLRCNDMVVWGGFMEEENGGEKKTRQKPPPWRLDFTAHALPLEPAQWR